MRQSPIPAIKGLGSMRSRHLPNIFNIGGSAARQPRLKPELASFNGAGIGLWFQPDHRFSFTFVIKAGAVARPRPATRESHNQEIKQQKFPYAGSFIFNWHHIRDKTMTCIPGTLRAFNLGALATIQQGPVYKVSSKHSNKQYFF